MRTFGCGIKIINRVLTGHSYDSIHLNMIGRIDSNMCPFCRMTANSEHVIFHCLEYNSTRQKHPIFKDFTELFTLLNTRKIEALLNF